MTSRFLTTSSGDVFALTEALAVSRRRFLTKAASFSVVK
jgi:hypothetical protein